MRTSRIMFLLEQIFRNTTLSKMINTRIEDIVLDARLYGILWKMTLKNYIYVDKHSWIFDTLVVRNNKSGDIVR